MRSPAERLDQLLAWQRPDAAFFASGACHVLAYRFLARHSRDCWRAIYLKPAGGFPGSHMYASDGRWAFDFNGWVPEPTLFDVTAKECERRWPGWTAERITVQEPLEVFCQRWNLRRPPSSRSIPSRGPTCTSTASPTFPARTSTATRPVELALVEEDAPMTEVELQPGEQVLKQGTALYLKSRFNLGPGPAI
jgi:hypothetical protein